MIQKPTKVKSQSGKFSKKIRRHIRNFSDVPPICLPGRRKNQPPKQLRRFASIRAKSTAPPLAVGESRL